MIDVGLRTCALGDCVAMALRGELDTADAERVSAAAAVAVAGGQLLIIDMEALEYIDCHAVNELLGVRELARLAGGDVRLAAAQGPVLRLLARMDVSGVHAGVDTAASLCRRSARDAVRQRTLGSGGQCR